MPESKHPNDPYGDIGRAAAEAAGDDQPPPIPAATVVLLRDADAGCEVLMLRKTSKISFGGMWVFPGGRIDAADYGGGDDVDAAARAAAARETQEEAGIIASPEDFVWFAHWTPPPTTPKRFATWFFVAKAASDAPIEVDGQEIDDHRWIDPRQALERHAEGEIDLVPPTWVTLYQLTQLGSASAVLERLAGEPPRYYQTRLAKRADGVRVAMWHGDAGYDDWEADRQGPSHRLIMAPGGFVFEHSAAAY